MKINTIFVLLIVLGAAVSAYPENFDGGYAGSFLELGLSARAVGMGQAYYAVSDDAAALFYNPAGAALSPDDSVTLTGETLGRKAKVGFSYRVMDLDRRLGFVSACFPVRDGATIGVGWLFKGVSNVIERDRQGEPGNELTDAENALSLSFSRKFSPIVHIGATGKFFIAKLANVTTTTLGFDIGTYLRFTKGEQLPKTSFFDQLNIGIVVGNLGAKYIWTTGDYWQQFGETGDSQTDDFPLLIGGGVSALVLDEKLLVAVDARKYNWHKIRINTGAEYHIHEMLTLRAGLDDANPTFGGGISHEVGRYTLHVDYAFSSAKAAERADHLFTVGFQF